MVAITVILAAVIGAFVLEIGDQQETAPNTSFTTEERDVYYCMDLCNSPVNTTVVQLTHGGGDKVPIDQVEFSVNGNDSAWGPIPQSAALDGGSNPGCPVSGGKNWCHQEFPEYESVRDLEGSEEWSSGQSFYLWGYGINGAGPDNDYPACRTSYGVGDYSHTYMKGCGGSSSHPVANAGPLTLLSRSGDKVTTTWEASSGGKTTTLQEYTTQ
jgi:hypothetical protein